MKKNWCCIIVGLLLLQTAALAMFMEQPQAPMAPVDRLVANTIAYIKEHPSDPMGPYTLARIHYFALAAQVSYLTTGVVEPLPTVEKTWPSSSTRREMTPEERLQRLTTSVENYRKALSMDAKNALFHLGLASVSEWAVNSSIQLGAIPGGGSAAPPAGDFEAQWREQAIASYREAFEMSVEKDLAIKTRPVSGDLSYLITYEAAQGYRLMVQARGVLAAEQPLLQRMQKAIETLVGKPFPPTPGRSGAITPIIFSLREAAPLADLLDERRVVAFDLDGTRRPQQRYTWIRPETGLLVWDPSNSGHITSGHQLFGSVSFNMFWSDGYRALDALDDNRDGELRGKELDGLAVWFDRNQNGVSQPGEVIPIAATGIAALSVQATGRSGASPMNSKGLTTVDGRVLPTYDWTTSPVERVPVS